MPKLEIKNISKTYKKGTVKALDDFSVTLTPGVYGLLGPNGAGKSTLMNIITDNLNSDSGKVLYNDEDIKKLGKNYRTVMGYMPQQQGLYDDFTLNRFGSSTYIPHSVMEEITPSNSSPSRFSIY